MQHTLTETKHSRVGYETYLAVWAALIVLTGLTVAAAKLDVGLGNIIIAIGIATLKASLVILYFMHLKFEHPFTWAFLGFAVLLLVGLITSSVLDAFIPSFF